MHLEILYDEPQEADWFKSLHPNLAHVAEHPMSDAQSRPLAAAVLAYDRPDIILMRSGSPILVVEETVEVPSGHNVGQRFARLAAAAEQRVPSVYFGPYAARKHGGATEGPRYMNLRLFDAIDAMSRATRGAVTTINWPVDSRYEVRRDKAKDADMRDFMSTFLALLPTTADHDLSQAVLFSDVHKRMVQARDAFASKIRQRTNYDAPPSSVEIIPSKTFEQRCGNVLSQSGITASEVVVYHVGMRSMRSDPYTGMAMLYHYLYIAEHPDRALILSFPHLTFQNWQSASARPNRKDVRLYKHACEGILFSDTFRAKAAL